MDIGVQKVNKDLNALLKSRDSNRFDVLDRKIKILHATAWRDKWAKDSDQYTKWLSNFKDKEEQLNEIGRAHV